MATIKLNGQSASTLCFSDSINIVEFSDSSGGTKASITLAFQDFQSSVTADSQYYITILDETITNVMSPRNATNKRFYIGSTAATAAYAANALNACESLVADWDISNSGNSVTLNAKTVGQKLLNVASAVTTNIPSSGLTVTSGDGSATSSVFGGKVMVQVSGGEGTVRLEKTVYDKAVGFNISPILSSFADFGEEVPFSVVASTLTVGGTYSTVGSAISGYTTYGYLANQSSPYLPMENTVLLNNHRGESVITLFTYANEVPFTIFAPNGGTLPKWEAYTSTGSRTSSGNCTEVTASTNGNIKELKATVPSSAFTKSYYVDIVYGTGRTRFNVIKPIKMAEGYTRIYWRNEYGGVSFFDFTGSKSETDSVDVETYNKNFYGFYNNPTEFEEKAAYKNTTTKEVKLTSHLMEESGKWIANSLIRSRNLWTYVNGNKQFVIPKSIEVEEDQTYNGIYTITFTYEYSQLS